MATCKCLNDPVQTYAVGCPLHDPDEIRRAYARIAELERRLERADALRQAERDTAKEFRAERDVAREGYIYTLDTFERWISQKMWDDDAAKSWIKNAKAKLKPSVLQEIRRRRAALEAE